MVKKTIYILHKIEVAQAFDELSILAIKKINRPGQKQKNFLDQQINDIDEEIDKAIGSDLAKEIILSKFYSKLFDANLKVFRYVDESKWKEAAAANMERFEAKKALQKHFFGENLKEIKI